MAKKALQPADVKRALKESITELNRLLKIAENSGLTIVIKPENSILSNRPVSSTKSLLAISYPEATI